MNYWELSSSTFCQTNIIPLTVQLVVHGRAKPPPLIICNDFFNFCIFHSKIYSNKFYSFVSLVLFPHGSPPPPQWVLLRFVVSYIYNKIWKYLIIMFCRVCCLMMSRAPPPTPQICHMNKLIFVFITERCDKIGFLGFSVSTLSIFQSNCPPPEQVPKNC